MISLNNNILILYQNCVYKTVTVCPLHSTKKMMIRSVLFFFTLRLFTTNSLVISSTRGSLDPPYVNADPNFWRFNRKVEQGTLWPLPQPDDVGCLIEHGLHCVEVVQGYFEVNVTDDMENDSPRMHIEHCSQVVHRVLRYFEANPTYT